MSEFDFLGVYTFNESNVSFSTNPDSEGRRGIANYSVSLENKTVQVTFYPRNALPILLDPSINKPVYIFGSKPPWRTDQDWERFIGFRKGVKIVDSEEGLPMFPDSTNPTSVLVETNPLELVNVARFLDPDNYPLARLYRSLVQPINEHFFAEFMDLVIAGKFIDPEGNLKASPDFEGEILMVCALLGYRNAAAELMRRKLLLKAVDQSLQSPSNIDLEARTDNGLSMKDLIAVHATGYLPYVDTSGNIYIRSSFDNSRGFLCRPSIHFALNHQVVGHKWGSWDEKPYVVLAPLTDLIELNGHPFALRPEDTFFMTSPYEPLRLPPSAILIRPVDDTEETKVPIRTVGYNFYHLSSSDLENIVSQWANLFWSYYEKTLMHKHTPYDYGSGSPANHLALESFIQAQLKNAHTKLWEEIHMSYPPSYALFAAESPSSALLETLAILQGGFKGLLPVVFRGIFTRLGRIGSSDKLDQLMMINLPPEVSSKNRFIQAEIIRMTKDWIHRDLAAINKSIVVERTIASLGYRVENIEPEYINKDYIRYFGTPAWAKAVLELAKRVGISTAIHGDMVEAISEWCLNGSVFGGGISNYLMGFHNDMFTPDQIREQLQTNQQKLLANFLRTSPQFRRVIYLTGAYQIADFWA